MGDSGGQSPCPLLGSAVCFTHAACREPDGYSVIAPHCRNAAALVTSAVDTSADVTLLITGQKAVAGEVLTLKAYSIEVLDR